MHWEGYGNEIIEIEKTAIKTGINWFVRRSYSIVRVIVLIRPHWVQWKNPVKQI